MKKDEIYNDENENGRKIKKVFKEIYFDEFEDLVKILRMLYMI